MGAGLIRQNPEAQNLERLRCRRRCEWDGADEVCAPAVIVLKGVDSAAVPQERWCPNGAQEVLSRVTVPNLGVDHHSYNLPVAASIKVHDTVADNKH